MPATPTRWRGARIVGAALKVLAWIVLVVGIIAVIFTFIRFGVGFRAHGPLPGGGFGAGGFPRAARLSGLGIVAAIGRLFAIALAFLLLYGAGVALQMLATIADNSQRMASGTSTPGAAPSPFTPYPAAPPTPPSVTPGPSQRPSAGADDPTYPPRDQG